MRLVSGLKSRAEQRFAQKLRDSKTNLPLNALIERVLTLLRLRSDPRWMLFVVALFLVLLSGCAATPTQCPPPAQPPSELMVAPPPPGASTARLEAILKQGRTSAPTSTTSPPNATPR